MKQRKTDEYCEGWRATPQECDKCGGDMDQTHYVHLERLAYNYSYKICSTCARLFARHQLAFFDEVEAMGDDKS